MDTDSNLFLIAMLAFNAGRAYASGANEKINEDMAAKILNCFKPSQNDNSVKDDSEDSIQLTYGLKGLADLLNVSMPTAQKIKNSGKLDPAITYVGRKMIIDKKMALQLLSEGK